MGSNHQRGQAIVRFPRLLLTGIANVPDMPELGVGLRVAFLVGQGHHLSQMMPRFRATVIADVRSSTPSLVKMWTMGAWTVLSLIEGARAIALIYLSHKSKPFKLPGAERLALWRSRPAQKAARDRRSQMGFSSGGGFYARERLLSGRVREEVAHRTGLDGSEDVLTRVEGREDGPPVCRGASPESV